MLSTIILSFGTVAIGAIIGTYGGVYFINKKNEEKNIQLRKLACSAIDLFKEYARNSNTYKSVENNFNNKFNISKKRAILVLLHKLGIPILLPITKNFDIKNIEFSDEKIDKEFLVEIYEQINSGYCDNLFYLDVDKYYNDELIIKTKRDIALRYIEHAMCNIEVDGDAIYLKDGWHKKFSEGELNTIFVFKIKNSSSIYYQDGKVNYEEIEKLKSDVKKGLWDEYLNWDIDAYRNVIAQKDTANLVSEAIQLQRTAQQQQPILTPELVEQIMQALPQQLAQLQDKTPQQEENNDTK